MDILLHEARGHQQMAHDVHLLRGGQVGSMARHIGDCQTTGTEKTGGGGEVLQVRTCRSPQDVSGHLQR